MSTINNYTRLHFFTDTGNELYTQKQYSIMWELIPDSTVSNYFKSIPNGYIIGDIENTTILNDDGTVTTYKNIKADSLEVHFLLLGLIYYDNTEEPENYTDDSIERLRLIFNQILNTFFYIDNKIRITVSSAGTVYTNDYDINFIFDYQKDVGISLLHIYTGDYIYEDYIMLNKLTLVNSIYTDNNSTSTLYEILQINTPNIGMLFPFVKYQISLYQKLGSINFINANTIIILMEDANGNYITPYIYESYDLSFVTTINSETYIIDNDNDYNIVYNNTKKYTDFYVNEDTYEVSIKPIYFTIGTISDTEGCYLNYVGLYTSAKDNSEYSYFLGAISVKTEFIGEDERFRTLLGNFGIPDPIKYSNLFAEQEYDEELADYLLINNKSKELFLSYTDIFSYIGTYKALINAVHFLGYNDIIFKEWYKIYDVNDLLKDVAVLVIDTSTGKFYKNVLSEYGIAYEDYIRYTKLNKLTMVYHLNELQEDLDESDMPLIFKIPTHLYTKTYEMVSDIINANQSIFLKIGYEPTNENISIINDIKINIIDYLVHIAKNISNYNEITLYASLSQHINNSILSPILETISKSFINDIINNDILNRNAYINNSGLNDIYASRYLNDFKLSDDKSYYYLDNDNAFSSVTNTWNKANNSFYITNIPTIKTIYKYRNTEIIAKLHSIKDWLEKNIIGANAYILDITAEGIIFHQVKTLAYVTLHELHDFYTEGYFTPTITNITNFNNSCALITGTLNEFTGLTFLDYEDVKFSSFIKKSVNLPYNEYSDISTLYISNSIETPVLGDEYEFELTVTPKNNTLYEFSDLDNQIYISNGEITLLDDYKKDASINKKYLPTIYLEIANIRKCYGKWENNIEYSIREVINSSTGNTEYELDNIGNGINHPHYINNKRIKLIPDYDFIYDSTYYKKIEGDTSINNLFAIVDNTYYNIDSSRYIKTQTNTYVKSETGIYITLTDTITDSNAININAYTGNIDIVNAEESIASLSYTEHNKWHIPMIIISGYKFDIDIPNQYKDLYDIYNKYLVLDIIKGHMSFNNNDANIQALLSLDNLNIIDNVTNDMNVHTELNILTTFTYHSLRTPFVIINDSSIIYDTSQNLNINIDNIIDITTYKQNILDNTLIYLNSTIDSDNYLEMQLYKDDNTFNNDVSIFINKLQTCKKKQEQYNKFIDIYNAYYKSIKYLNIDVHHLGEYNIEVKAYDGYNNTFVNKSDDTYNLTAPAILYNIAVDLENSGNDTDFYKYNKDGIILSTDMLSNILLDISTNNNIPKFSKHYNIYDIDYNTTENKIYYNNLTYALDTPKNNDYFIATNLSEICVGVNDNIYYTSNGEGIDIPTSKINMLDENPNDMLLYIKNASVNICIYDEIYQEDVSIAGPFIVNDYYYLDGTTDINYSDLSYIILEGLEAGLFIDNYANDITYNNYKAYMINVSLYNIKSYENNYNTMHCTIIFNDTVLYFNINDVIKVSYHKTVIDDMNAFTKITNECVYRILDTGFDDDLHFSIIIDGLIDNILTSEQELVDSIENGGITISYPYKSSVHYAVRVVDDAVERVFNNNYSYYSMKTEFTYTKYLLFLNNYIDDTFSGYIYNYDLNNLKNTWFNYSIYNTESELYYYFDYPITVSQGKYLILYPDMNNTIFNRNYKTIWKWYTKTIDDTNYWDNYINNFNDELWFECINNILTVKAEPLGVNNIYLTCIDKYGNTVTTTNNAKIYIK